MFIKTIFQDSRKVKRIINYVSKPSLYLLMYQNLLISGEKMVMPAELKRWVMWFIYFLVIPRVRYNCAKFDYCRICVTEFRRAPHKSHPHPWAAPKKPILNRVKAKPTGAGRGGRGCYNYLHPPRLGFINVQRSL